MKLSGFTIARNVIKYNYPIIESINSILPICDEFVVNVGESEDATLDLIKSINSPKLKIIQTRWDMASGSGVLSEQTNRALKECAGDWAFYLQSDEVVHEADLPKIWRLMNKFKDDKQVDALRFYWFHFYGSFYRYRVDQGWYQKQDRIIKNNGAVESFGDAYGFRRKDGLDLRRANTNCFIYHYGWVQPQELMMQRRINADRIGFISLGSEIIKEKYDYGNLKRFAPYFGSHPKVMAEKIKKHELSQEDLREIRKDYWWHPMQILRCRYKTHRRIREKIE